MQKKKIALLASILIATLAVGVYAVILSNTLTASWTLKEAPGTNLELYWTTPYWYPSGDLNRGQWIYASIGLRNNGLATYTVTDNFTIHADAALPLTCIKKIEYSIDGGAHYLDMTNVLAIVDAYTLKGYFGPVEGFQVVSPYDEATRFRIMFDGNAPLTGYTFNAWVEQVP